MGVFETGARGRNSLRTNDKVGLATDVASAFVQQRMQSHAYHGGKESFDAFIGGLEAMFHEHAQRFTNSIFGKLS